MEKTFMIVSGGEGTDEIGATFVKGQDEREALLYFIETIEGHDLKDSVDYHMANNLLEEFPLGIAEFDPTNIQESYIFNWIYELPDVPEPEED